MDTFSNFSLCLKPHGSNCSVCQQMMVLKFWTVTENNLTFKASSVKTVGITWKSVKFHLRLNLMGFDWCCDCGFVASICCKWMDHLDHKNPTQIYIHMMFHSLRPHLHWQKIWVIGWKAGTVVVWMLYRALNDVEKVCCSLELIQFVSCAFAPLLCWISFPLSLPLSIWKGESH